MHHKTKTMKNDAAVASKSPDAVEQAKLYIKFTPFSYKGLVRQLIYGGGFSEQEAIYGADNCGADWDEQARMCAEEYIDLLGEGEHELIEQLEYEGFTEEQAKSGAQKARADKSEIR